MPQVRSRVNGLVINIPADAAGVVGRFGTKNGNDLVFEKPKQPIRMAKDTAMSIESELPDKPSGKAGKAGKGGKSADTSLA